MKKKIMALALALSLGTAAAAADTVSFSGTVEAGDTWQVYAPIGGTAEEVLVSAGEYVQADTVIARVKTTRVYASRNGTVTAVYGQPGDSAESVSSLYGAVMYLEGETLYTVNATTEKAYDRKDNYVVHSGEQVYLASRDHTADTGTGLITSVTENGYTVRVASGDFYIGDTLDIFREASGTASSRIGRGTVARVAPVAVGGSGSIVSCAVKAGDTVTKGQLLFETVTGSFDGDVFTGTEIKAGAEGVIASLSVEKGGNINENSVVAVIYPKNAMRVTVEVPELDLKEIQVGQKVIVELDWNQDDGVAYEGTVDMISRLGTTGSENATYKARVSFIPDENTRYGMSALVTTTEEEETAAAEPEREDGMEAEAAEAAEESGEQTGNGEEAAAGEDSRGRRPGSGRPGKEESASGEMAEGFTPGEKPEGFSQEAVPGENAGEEASSEANPDGTGE